ncbi:MAG: amino acid permease, partial [Sphingomonadales bacterium]|nr:amino acid permease [Sphingomonadales bacterium]
MNKATSEQQNKPQLARDIKFWGASFISLNSMIGAGIFALPAAIAVNAGIFSPWLFLLVGALFTTIVLVFAELASHFKETGGPVLYATETFGPLTGFNTGWLLFLSRMTAGAANTTVMVIYLGKIFPYFADGAGRALFITVLIAWLTYANVRGVKDGVRTIGLFSIFKLTPLIL